MKVFLGGTVKSTWRERIIPKLELDYFNPVIEGWDDYNQQVIKDGKADSDFHLYTITPKMETWYSIAEVVDDSNKRPTGTVLCLMRYESELSFSEAQWKSLQAVAKMVMDNGGMVFFTLEDTAQYLNDMERIPG